MEEFILKLANEDKKLSCAAAFKIAKELDIDISEVGKKADEMGIKISNCELGQFGKFKHDIPNDDVEIFLKIKPFLDEKNRINCIDARNIAKQTKGFKAIRGVLKSHKIDVKYCKLGCFKEKKGKKVVVKTKIWIENSDGELLFGKGKTEVLDVIDQTGSIKKAAELLDMNYKKCWNHLKILEKNFDIELFETKPGGGKGAGTSLKPKAHELMKAYKQLQADIEEFSNKRFKELFLNK